MVITKVSSTLIYVKWIWFGGTQNCFELVMFKITTTLPEKNQKIQIGVIYILNSYMLINVI